MKYSTDSIIGMVFFLALAPLTTWADPITRSGTYSMEHDGLTRTFRVHLPRDYKANNPMPLVLMYHGWGGNENAFLGSRRVTSEADKRGYILVAPRGLGSGDPDNSYNSWTFGAYTATTSGGSTETRYGSATGLDGVGGAICGAGTPNYRYQSCFEKYGDAGSNSCGWTHCQTDDVDFTLALIEYLKINLSVDTQNIFAMGGSNGGMFTWELGQNPASAGTFRAIAPLIGLPHRAYLEAYGKDDDMPVLVITGTRDKVVPPGDWEDPSHTTTSNGSDRFYYTGATAITRSWAEKHGCYASGPNESAVPFNDGIRKTDCRTYCSEDPGWPRVLDCRARMGHSYSLSWSWKLIMNFFDAHSE